jgi:hypothetical protein
MESRFRRHWQTPLTLLFCGLVLLAHAERRMAELDFDSTGVVRIENNDKPDGDEIFNRLTFVDDKTEPIAPAVGDASHAAVVSLESGPLGLVSVRLSESRAPPHSLPSHV